MIKSAPRRPGVLTVILLSTLLVGCVTVFPKEKPAQLYRFGDAPQPRLQAAAPAQSRFTVQIVPMNFDRAAYGDRILTVTGTEAAYVKGARWVASAGSMFETAVVRAFDADGGPARIVPRGEAAHVDYLLKLDVRAFEARYDHGPDSPPTVVVEVYAALGAATDRTSAGERIFQAQAPAADNRVGAIAVAYDVAVGKVLADLVAWVDAKGVT